jgi:hypothetical protein
MAGLEVRQLDYQTMAVTAAACETSEVCYQSIRRAKV